MSNHKCPYLRFYLFTCYSGLFFSAYPSLIRILGINCNLIGQLAIPFDINLQSWIDQFVSPAVDSELYCIFEALALVFLPLMSYEAVFSLLFNTVLHLFGSCSVFICWLLNIDDVYWNLGLVCFFFKFCIIGIFPKLDSSTFLGYDSHLCSIYIECTLARD